MKKVVVVIALAAILATGTAFADHPDGLGIGIVGTYGIGWGGAGGALSLKIPSVPIYWGISMGLSENFFRLGLTGDSYLIDQALVKDIGLHWFLGLGGWLDFYNHSTTSWENKKYSAASFGLGARLPIGLSWQPVKFLEIFLDVAPSLGLWINTEAKYKDSVGIEHTWREGGIGFPAWGIPLELGLRIWI
jgi:hypothetical protein